jgi:hypothetical protein
VQRATVPEIKRLNDEEHEEHEGKSHKADKAELRAGWKARLPSMFSVAISVFFV